MDQLLVNPPNKVHKIIYLIYLLKIFKLDKVIYYNHLKFLIVNKYLVKKNK